MSRRVYIAAGAGLLLLAALAWVFPQASPLWFTLFWLWMLLIWIGAVRFRPLTMQLLYRQGKFLRLARFCQKILNAPQLYNTRLLTLAGLYVSLAQLAMLEQQELSKADHAAEAATVQKQLEQLDIALLPVSLHTLYYLAKAKCYLYAHDYSQALAQLKQCSLVGIRPTQMGELFLLFSLLFVLTKQEHERALNYAAKACELSSNLLLAQANHAWVRHELLKLDGTTTVELQQLIARLPDNIYKQIYQTSHCLHSSSNLQPTG